ncbi:MAG TPA: hypothetical protein VMT51_01760 [Dongiaceae bacterium]|nr:hypothetical protein [Dongiaceae bacterium]
MTSLLRFFQANLLVALFSVLLAANPLVLRAQSALPKPDKDTVLKASDIKPRLFPESVFFRGQTAPTQMRNTGGVHFSDDLYVVAGLVDNSGYSTGIREKYQGYLISEVTLQVGGQTLKPGAYGIGFLDGGKFVVMDLGANELFQASSQRDGDLKRPVPLQVTSAGDGKYRLYFGREYIEFGRSR